MKTPKWIDRSLISFLIIGLGNTVLSLTIQLVLYSWAGAGYWISSGLAFVIASVSSFYLNRKFSFQSQGSLSGDGVRFALNIAVCYLLAYGAAQPMVQAFFQWFPSPLMVYHGQLALLLGNGLFTCLNYLGQRLFVFSHTRR